MTAQLSSASAVEAPRCGSATTPGSRSSAALGKVAQVVLEAVLAQRRDHRLVVDERVAREIEQHRAVLHHGEALGVDQVARGRQQRHVQRDEIGLPQQLLDAVPRGARSTAGARRRRR